MSSSTEQASPFLQLLPLELRLIIYGMFLPLNTSPNRWNCGPKQSIFLLSRPHEDATPKISCLGREPRPVSFFTGILSLRAVNRQIYNETNTLLNVNPINLRITDSLSFRDCSAVVTLDLLRHAWMRENVVHLEIYLASDGLRFTYPDIGHTLYYSPPRYPSKHGMLCAMIRNWMFGQKVKIEEPQGLKRLAEVLNTFRQLRTVDIMTDDDLLFYIWPDPLGDSNAFQALVDRGVVVEFKFPPFYNPTTVSRYREAFDAMLRRKQPWTMWSRKEAFKWVETLKNDRRLVAVGD